MSAPTATMPSESLSADSSPCLASGSSQTSNHLSPMGAGIGGAALGFGAGLVVAELLVPGLILGAVALVGLAAGNRIVRLVRNR